MTGRPRTLTGWSSSTTPNVERYMLESDVLRRRQLHTALLFGSSRTWRDRRRIWPGVLVGVILVAVIVAGLAVAGAFRKQQINDQLQKQKNNPSATAPASPGR
ncbi:hypothetical protein [Fodinicola acaciae]|uniref:hypothetical protein n=1 Tax=Fodinicola acaciae TaxID=2681555 RepID=UPI001C9E244D|nr:hypothetical protein [Fodinicola acaciae]